MKILFCLCSIFLISAYACSDANLDKRVLIFKNTPAWKLAKLIDKDDLPGMEDEIKKLEVSINYQEPLSGLTLLELAVRKDKYNAAEMLVKHGANPNIRNYHDGNNALIEAAHKYDTSKFLKLLLSHGGDPNDVNYSEKVKNFPPTTALITAAFTNLENVRLLADAGADVNYKTPIGNTVLKQAALMNQVFIVRYLLIEKKAEFNYVFMKTIDGKDLYLTHYMRNWPFKIGSDEWKCKMEIAAYLKQYNMDYFATPIPKHMLDRPKDYLEKY